MAIKIGDEVIPNCAVVGLIPGKRYKVTGRNGILINVEGNPIDYRHSYFDIIAPSDTQSPIRTRREIVPGVYGNVAVEKHSYGMTIVSDMSDPTPEELRESAHILNQIAEVLEENAG